MTRVVKEKFVGRRDTPPNRLSEDLDVPNEQAVVGLRGRRAGLSKDAAERELGEKWDFLEKCLGIVGLYNVYIVVVD